MFAAINPKIKIAIASNFKVLINNFLQIPFAPIIIVPIKQMLRTKIVKKRFVI